ncbi:MAG TPA: FAD-binding oxidoreductase, partial [Novosphingobium sp.]|nr:FAD-binding oxidoreductase [Novosphingobium sp.]
MTTAATLIDWDALSQRLSPIEVSTAEKVIKRKSRDYYWFSPVLKAQLEEVRADAIVTPASAGEVSQVVRFCVENRLPLTLRGGGTGNYGQAMPLKGGVVMDMTRLTAICHIGDGVVRAEAGAKMYDIEQAVNAAGYELRFFPSTWKSATIGGFVAGGSTGCGAIGFGTLHSGDNVRAAKVLTAEESPRILELTGRDAQAVVHAYGTNGVILEVELALAPRRAWHDRIVAFDDLPTTLAFAAALGADGAIPKRQLTIYGATTASLIRPVADLDTGACPLVLTMIAEEALPAFDALLAA